MGTRFLDIRTLKACFYFFRFADLFSVAIKKIFKRSSCRIYSDGQEQFRQKIQLSEDQVAQFFNRAGQMSARRIQDKFDYLPSFVKGGVQ